MGEAPELVKDMLESAGESKFNSRVAVLVAMVAVMMALCNIRHGKTVLAMSQAQVHSLDAWSYYQAKSTKQHIAENMGEQLSIQLLLQPAGAAQARETLQAQVAKFRAQAKAYSAERDSIRKQAEGFAEEYDRLDARVDQFDVAEAAFSIAVALSGISALTRKRWLFAMGFLAAVFGAFAGLSGFMGWPFHLG
jgi:hypothetical protein